MTTAPQDAPTRRDHRELCGFCAELERRSEHNLIVDTLGPEVGERYLLFESENFAVVPCIGAIVPGYVVVVPRPHVLSSGHLPPSVDAEFAALAGEVAGWLATAFGLPTVVFEHGSASFRARGGSCTDHAHVHVLPFAHGEEMRAQFARDFPVEPAHGLPGAARRFLGDAAQPRPYLYLGEIGGGGLVADATGAPSQYFRRVVARLAGAAQWDWVPFRYPEHMWATIERAPRRDAR